MKCFECKSKVSSATRVFYLVNYHQELGRDICEDCYKKILLKRDGCGFVNVVSSRQRVTKVA